MSPKRGGWIRPLLEASRSEIEADLRGVHQPWREDRSNRDRSYARNRVRHEVIPALLGPVAGARRGTAADRRGALAKRVADTLREVRQAQRWLERRAARLLSISRVSAGRDGIALDCSPLASAPEPILSLVLRRAWDSLGPDKGLTRPALRGLAHLAAGSRDGRLSLASGWISTRRGTTLRIEPAKSRIEGGTQSESAARSLSVPGRVRLRGADVRASWVNGSRARRVMSDGAGGECFARSHLKGRLELRLGRTDEWFTPFGHRQARRLGVFLKRAGVPRSSRTRQMVLADGEGILWVVGVRRSARAPLTPGTRKALWVRAST